MSEHHDDAPPYSQTYITAWTVLATLAAAVIFLMFCLNQPLTDFFHWVWNLIRYIFRPII